MKIVYGWVVNWGNIGPDAENRDPVVTVDLFFSSKEKFVELFGTHSEEILVPVAVPDDYDILDFIPENY